MKTKSCTPTPKKVVPVAVKAKVIKPKPKKIKLRK